MRSRFLCAALLASGALATLPPRPAQAQSVPTIDITKRTGRSQYAFGRAYDAKELPDGRVIASDSKERAFQLLDFGKNSMTVLGEAGDGPLMYASAGPVLVGPADTLLLYAGKKFLKVSPQGTIVEDVDIMSHLDTHDHLFTTALGVDSKGGFYYLAPVAIRDSANHFTFLPTTQIARVELGPNTFSVVDSFKTRRDDQVNNAPPVPGTVVVPPYLFRDAWAVRPDGLGAHVLADGYEVIWTRDGKNAGRTGPLPFQPIPLTTAEQQAFRDSLTEATRPKAANTAPGSGAPTPTAFGSGSGGFGGMVRATSSSGADAPPAPGTPQTQAPPRTFVPGAFPDHKPAILASTPAALFDADGRLWIARERAHGDPLSHYDIVVEGRGVIAHVTLPAHTRVLSVGHQGIYVARTEDTEEWLERYSLPKL